MLNTFQKVGFLTVAMAVFFSLGFFPWDGSLLPFVTLSLGSATLVYGGIQSLQSKDSSLQGRLIAYLGIVLGGTLCLLTTVFALIATFPSLLGVDV